jgi:two-component system, OmpR family, sensor histidine kinase CiaH
MFQKARLKLTAWYLLIIMIISFIFSAVIFNVQMAEVDRFARAQRMRLERQFPAREFLPSEPPYIDPDLIEETKDRLLLNLIELNGIIIIISGGLGYFLAGKTLRPIKEMIDDQDRFISDSSHELRTPLTSLKSAMEVALMDKNLTLADAKKLIKENIEDVNCLQNLSDSLIKLSKNKEQKDNLKIAKISLSKLVNSAIEKIKPQADQKAVVIKKHLNNQFFFGDQEKLESVMTIVLDNAVKYSPQNKQIIVTTSKSKKNISISITDHGQGISKKDLPFVFDRFFRADMSRTKTKISGFGLGLSIAKMIIEKHHGQIKVKSHLGKGSVFTIILPQNFS